MSRKLVVPASSEALQILDLPGRASVVDRASSGRYDAPLVMVR